MQNLNNAFKSVFMIKSNKIFLKRLKYFKDLKDGPFVSILSLQRIIAMILGFMHEKYKFLVVTDKSEEGRKFLYIYIYFFFIIQCVKTRVILCPHQPPTRVITQVW